MFLLKRETETERREKKRSNPFEACSFMSAMSLGTLHQR